MRRALHRRSDTAGIEPLETPQLTPWDRVKLARHQNRPHSLDYINNLMTGFIELHGDRLYGDDPAIVGGLARFGDQTIVVIGHQKGGDTKENIRRNFGMVRPEGYRKAERLMRHAEKFGIPVVTFIDTPGAEPGIGSEERGPGTAIAESLMTMAQLKTPVVAVIIGEGGSGGALAIGMADRMLMLENAIYAVASPEACAAILWKDAAKAPQAAETMRITADDLYYFDIVDEVIPEPSPAHESPQAAIAAVGHALEQALQELMEVVDQPSGLDRLMEQRYERFRRIGVWSESLPLSNFHDS